MYTLSPVFVKIYLTMTGLIYSIDLVMKTPILQSCMTDQFLTSICYTVTLTFKPFTFNAYSKSSCVQTSNSVRHVIEIELSAAELLTIYPLLSPDFQRGQCCRHEIEVGKLPTSNLKRM